ncbi:hypothetical protein PUNSTDRAFT_47606 [Punctularia strigosozonata HHB-11173 SS5]|uniref:Uncharacterized protein n=1 Tax=Punctularia strigosozonata (strain HHB-11173) TaxID=741275 RepID=R7S3D2_PUNST|nr:uncharacterized protein PUNSTDRAFT_47606 [Punctularia strigosozonata HHB-11173 SS5]EIN04374.1 hypothetical protein PUNSTDRAFT_47606 [Punctularia strigosozonata HHB-11173 SS5]
MSLFVASTSTSSVTVHFTPPGLSAPFTARSPTPLELDTSLTSTLARMNPIRRRLAVAFQTVSITILDTEERLFHRRRALDRLEGRSYVDLDHEEWQFVCARAEEGSTAAQECVRRVAQEIAAEEERAAAAEMITFESVLRSTWSSSSIISVIG